MRLNLATLVAAFLVTGSALAAPPSKPPAKSKVAHVDPLPTTKADVSVVGRAVLAHDLPKTINAAEHARLDAVVAELKADRVESGVAHYRAWADGSVKPFTRDEAAQVGLWVFREGILSRNEELANAADRVRFFDERNAAIDDSLALLKGAVIVKKPVLVARMVVLTPYVREMKGDEKRERQISRDALGPEITALETKAEEVKAERDKLRAAFNAADAKTTQQLQVLAALMKTTSEMRLGPR
jgi:hypothetical protein